MFFYWFVIPKPDVSTKFVFFLLSVFFVDSFERKRKTFYT